MYLIALCDDEIIELNKTEQMLNRYEKNHPDMCFLIERFENAEELLYMVREKDYVPDLIFMDIYMPDRMGIDVAEELRRMGNESSIVFLTTSREHALEAFGVDAAQYLVKPASEEVLFPMMDKILEDVEKERRRYLLLRTEGRIQRVAVGDIVYCEAQGKTQCVYLAGDTKCLLRTTMTKLYEMLSPYQEFAKVGAAYIVNLEHVDSLGTWELQMDDGKKIYLPRGSYQPLRERYLEYYCEEKKD